MFIVRHVVTARIDMLVSTRSTHRTCRVLSTWLDKWNLGLCMQHSIGDVL